jgi:hypothetical protein
MRWIAAAAISLTLFSAVLVHAGMLDVAVDPEFAIAQLLGHKDVRTTIAY